MRELEAGLEAALAAGGPRPPPAAAAASPRGGSPASAHDGVLAYVVRGAGVAGCNGTYTRSLEQDGVPSFINGETLMLRYRLPSGTQWWYLADQRSLDRSTGDYYRVQSSSDTPPLAGWPIDGQTPDGQAPPPTVSVASAAVTPALPAVPQPVGAAAGVPSPAPAPAAALLETEGGWAALDRFAVRERSERLAAALRDATPRLADFEVHGRRARPLSVSRAEALVVYW